MSRGPGTQLGDNVVLQNTGRNVNGNMAQLMYKLPNGEELKSEWMPHDQLKAGVLIGWCQLVRDTINELAARDREAARGSTAPDRAGTPPSTPASTAQTVAHAPTDPTEFIRQQCDAAATELSESTEALLAAQERQAKAQDALIKWETMADTLGINLGENEDESTDASNTEDLSDNGSDDSVSGVDAIRAGGTDGD